jgi:hypothetical protein
MTIEDLKTELREISELSDKATPAPWHENARVLDQNARVIASTLSVDFHYAQNRQNGEFIAASRNLTPKMAKALLMAITLFEWGDDAKSLEKIRREWEVQP